MTKGAGETVLVIGAGIIGISCAHYLSEKGYSVTVIDKGTIAGACSEGNCGHILPSHILPLNQVSALKTGLKSLFDREAAFKVKPRLDLSFLNWFWQFARRCNLSFQEQAAEGLNAILRSSYAEFHSLMDTHSLDDEWRVNGLLYLYKDSAAAEGFAKDNAWCADNFGIEADYFDQAGVKQLDPAISDQVAAGYLYSQDAMLRTDVFAKNWSELLKTRGVTFVENCSFTGLEKENGRVTTIETSQGFFEADHLLVATGAMSPDFAQALEAKIPVEPGKGYALTIQKPDICPEISLVLPQENIAITTFSDRFRIGSIMEFVGYQEGIPDYRIAQFVKKVQPYLRSDLNQPVLEKWFGFRPMTWDSLPIIGQVPRLKNAYLATGHNMVGVMTAPGTGKLIAELIAGEGPHIPAQPYSPNRFHS